MTDWILMPGIMHFNQMYRAGCGGSDAAAVCTRQMRGLAVSPTGFWPSQREAGSNCSGQGVPE